MQITETKSEGLSREYTINLPASEIEEKVTNKLKEIQRTAQIAGFRPGKVPVPVLRKRYGQAVLGEVLERAVGDSSRQALTEKGIRPAMQPEIEIRAMLGKYLPSPEDEFLAKAAELIASGDYSGAFPMAKQAFEINPDNIDSKYLYIDCLIETGAVPAARELLAEIKLVDQDQRYHTLQGKVELAEQAADTPEIRALQEQAEANPDDLQVKVDLAVALYQVQRFEEALELLYGVLLKDFGFGEAKKLILDIINALPDGDSLKSGYRRKVYSLMY